jgi:hypothetical protein
MLQAGQLVESQGAWPEDKLIGSKPPVIKKLSESCSNELAAKQSPAGKNASTEAEINLGIRHQSTTEDTTD